MQQANAYGGGGVKVQGGIYHIGRTQLYYVQGTLNGLCYRDDIVEQIIIPHMRHGLTLQQDNARPHTVAVVITALRNAGVTYRCCFGSPACQTFVQLSTDGTG